jgi:hypothetical protein
MWRPLSYAGDVISFLSRRWQEFPCISGQPLASQEIKLWSWVRCQNTDISRNWPRLMISLGLEMVKNVLTHASSVYPAFPLNHSTSVSCFPVQSFHWCILLPCSLIPLVYPASPLNHSTSVYCFPVQSFHWYILPPCSIIPLMYPVSLLNHSTSVSCASLLNHSTSVSCASLLKHSTGISALPCSVIPLSAQSVILNVKTEILQNLSNWYKIAYGRTRYNCSLKTSKPCSTPLPHKAVLYMHSKN